MNQIMMQQEMRHLHAELRERTPDNPALAGYKIYSQSDEDGIIAEIFRRIGQGNRAFVEFGCGDGRENNTHAMLLGGWRGTWIDGSAENIESIARTIPLESGMLRVRKEFVTRDNVWDIVADAITRYKIDGLDLLSIDLDGNDLYLLQEILKHTKPRVIIAEYNGKFPPPLRFTIRYNASHSWASDDYHGASLQSLVDELTDYRLVACNAIGSNAFFVRNDLASPFTVYSIEQLYQPGRYHLITIQVGQAPSLTPLRDVLST